MRKADVNLWYRNTNPQDLYDFNHNSGGLSIPAAITQLSYGNGGYGRTNGIIFRATVDILKDYEVKEIRLP
jgi:hypothetical protein